MINYIYKVVWNENNEENVFNTYEEARKFVDSCWEKQNELEEKKYITPFIYEVEVEVDEHDNQIPTGNEKAVFTYDSGEPKEGELSQPKLFDDSKYEGKLADDDSFSYLKDYEDELAAAPAEEAPVEKEPEQLNLFDAFEELDETWDNIEAAKKSRRQIIEAALNNIIEDEFKDDLEDEFEFEDIPEEVFYGENLYRLGWAVLADIEGNKIPANEEADLIDKIIDYAFNDYANKDEAKSKTAIYDSELAAKRFNSTGDKSEKILATYARKHPNTYCRAFGLTEDDVIVTAINIDNITYTVLMIKPELEIITKDQVVNEYKNDFTGEDPRGVRTSDEYDGRYENPEYLEKHPEQDVNNIVKAEESLEDTVYQDLNDDRTPKQPKEVEVESEPLDYKKEEIKAKRLNESSSQEIEEYYKEFKDEFGYDLNELIWGEDGFMQTKYPAGLPDFAGDIIYSEKYWEEFEQWLKDIKGIDLDKLQEDFDAATQEDAEALKDLLGEDARIVPCKRYDLVSHCPEETNVDCNLEKPALEKPLAGDNIDSKKFYKIEESKKYTNKSLREGFSNEEFKRFATACKVLGFVKLSEINKFAVDHNISSDKDLLTELEKAAAEKNN